MADPFKKQLAGAEGKAVLITWIDAHVLTEDWIHVEDIDLEMVCEVRTAGIYIGRGAGQIWVAQSVIPSSSHHACPFAIPASLITRIRILGP